MNKSLEQCLAAFGGTAPQFKLEALEAWLSERGDSSICVAAIGDERRCCIQAHGAEFDGVSQVAGRGGWWATWCAICAAVAKAEAFERAKGADVG